MDKLNSFNYTAMEVALPNENVQCVRKKGSCTWTQLTLTSASIVARFSGLFSVAE